MIDPCLNFILFEDPGSIDFDDDRFMILIHDQPRPPKTIKYSLPPELRALLSGTHGRPHPGNY